MVHHERSNIHLVDVTDTVPEKGVAKLVDRAAELRASDLFFLTNEQHVSVQMRHLGVVRPLSILTSDQGRRFIAHIRSLAGLDVGDRRHPTDGRWIYPGVEGQSDPVDLRVSIIPTLYGEDMALRILVRQTNLRSINTLGMEPDQEQSYRSMLESPGGMLLLTGPTGSGKTATLYASLVYLNNGRRKINTIEDPVEFAVDGLRQSQVNPAIELHFAEVLRGVMRQSPDAIMIGEIRDPETARIAVRAANSGILVLATVHAPTAAGGIQAMRGFNVHPHLLATSLRGAVSQRLVRTLCPKCKVEFDITHAPETFEEVKQWLKSDEGKKLYAAQGCEHCHLTGYADRTGIFEVVKISPAMRELIAQHQPSKRIQEQAKKEQMLSFREAALLKVARGQTSTEEIFNTLPSEDLLIED